MLSSPMPKETRRDPEPGARWRIAALLARLAVDESAMVFAKPDSAIGAQLAAIHDSAVRLRIGEFLRPDARVEIRFPGGAVACGDVKRCRPNERGYEVIVRLMDAQCETERGLSRMETRYPAAIGGMLHVSGIRGAAYAVTILDVSRSGLRVQSPCPVEIGSKIELTCPSIHIVGEVRYSRQVAADEFHLGILAGEEAPDLLALCDVSH